MPTDPHPIPASPPPTDDTAFDRMYFDSLGSMKKEQAIATMTALELKAAIERLVEQSGLDVHDAACVLGELTDHFAGHADEP